MKYLSLFIFIVILLSSCKENSSHQHKDDEKKLVQADSDKHNLDHKHSHANHHMHKTPVDELIKSFDSQERAKTQKPNQVISLFGNIKGKTIIDIGSGSGYFTFRLADKGAKVIAGDVNDQFHEHIRTKMKENEIYAKNIEIRKLPYDSPFLFSGEIHHALIVNTYHHIEERVNYFKEVKSGLKEDGMLMIVDFKKQHFKEEVEGPPYDMRLSKNLVIEELKRAGFVNFEVNDQLLPYQYIIMAKK